MPQWIFLMHLTEHQRQVASKAKTDTARQAILDTIGDQLMGRKQIEGSTGIPTTTLKRHLADMVADGQLER